MVEIFHFFMKQVVPFTPSAGVLEWVNGTLPLGEYLIGRSVKERHFTAQFFVLFIFKAIDP